MTILFNIGEEVTIKKMSSIIGNSMRIIPHIEATIIIDTKEDIFYIIRNTGKRSSTTSNGLYEVIFIGYLDRLIKLLMANSLDVGEQ